MIISASRRTDIPAFFSRWFLNRIEEGNVEVKNPFYPGQVRKVQLKPDKVDCIVFWTKNPAPILPGLNRLCNYRYYFLFTLNPYDRSIEKGLPDTSDLIRSFIELSEIIGPDRVIWRYDPVLYTRAIDRDFHRQAFADLAEKLQDHTDKCIISFIDIYRKNKSLLAREGIYRPDNSEQSILLQEFHDTAEKRRIRLQTCAEIFNFPQADGKSRGCIDNELVSSLCGREIVYKKDTSQRDNCLCHRSIDIGSYGTCLYNCIYCYAKSNNRSA